MYQHTSQDEVEIDTYENQARRNNENMLLALDDIEQGAAVEVVSDDTSDDTRDRKSVV